jgi:hypothetical protein
MAVADPKPNRRPASWDRARQATATRQELRGGVTTTVARIGAMADECRGAAEPANLRAQGQQQVLQLTRKYSAFGALHETTRLNCGSPKWLTIYRPAHKNTDGQRTLFRQNRMSISCGPSWPELKEAD